MDVNRIFIPENLTRKIASEEAAYWVCIKKHTPCQGESSFSPARSPIPGEKRKERAFTLCFPLSAGFREIAEAAEKSAKKGDRVYRCPSVSLSDSFARALTLTLTLL
jgi:hypothetical protein